MIGQESEGADADKAAGQDVKQYGASWYVVSAAGQKVEKGGS